VSQAKAIRGFSICGNSFENQSQNDFPIKSEIPEKPTGILFVESCSSPERAKTVRQPEADKIIFERDDVSCSFESSNKLFISFIIETNRENVNLIKKL
jgi:hypothetical protein